MTEAQILASIDKLILDMQQGDISLQDYGKKLSELQADLTTVQDVTFNPEQREDQYPEVTIREYLQGVQPLTGLKAEAKLRTDYGDYKSLTPQEQDDAFKEAFELSQREIEEQVNRKKYTTGEFDEPIKPDVGISAIRDAQAGLVYDPEMKGLREAGTVELLKEGMFRQVRATPEQREQFLEQLANDRQGYAQSLFAQGLSKDEVVKQLDKYDSLNEKLGQQVTETGYVVETPLGWGLRMLNTGSALAAPVYRAVQENVFGLESAPADYDVYRKADKDVSQFAANVALNQGMYSAFMDYIPVDERDNGWVMAAGFGGELAIPVTPAYAVTVPLKATGKALNVGGKALGSAKLAKAGMVVDQPLRTALGFNDDLAKLNAASVEVENGLRSIDSPNPKAEATRIQNELAKKGTLSSITVREKGALAIGDVYGGNAALDRAVKQANKVGDEFVHFEDIGVTESPYINSVFDTFNDDIVKVSDLEAVVRQQDEILNSLKGTQPDAEPVLARAYRVYADAKNSNNDSVMGSSQVNRGAVSADYDLLKPRLKSQAILNAEYSGMRIDIVEIIRDSAKRPLTNDELLRLNDAFNPTDANNFGDLTSSLRVSSESPRTVYHSTRGAVGEVVQDNLLKNIPEDYVYISRDVAVPVARLKGAEGAKFNEAVRTLLDARITKGVDGTVFEFSEESAKRLLRYLGSKGLDPKNSTYRALRLQSMGRGMEARSASEVISPAKMRALQEQVSGQLARDMLGGVKLRTGAATAELAEIPIEVRGSVIPMGQGQRATRSIFAQGLRNAKAIVGKKRLFFSERQIESFQQPMVRRFNKELNTSNNAALVQVDTELSEFVSKAVANGRAPQDGFNDYLAKLGKDEQSLYMSNKVGTEFEIEDLVSGGVFETSARQSMISQRVVNLDAVPDYLIEGFDAAKLSKMSGVYGDDAVEDYLKTLGIRYNDAGELSPEAMNKLAGEMSIMDSVLQSKQMYPVNREKWDFVIGRFFGADRVKPLYENELMEGILAKNKNLPVYAQWNLRPFTIDEFKNVIEEMRNTEMGSALKDKGLFKVGITGKEEAIMIPMLEYAVGVQRKMNMRGVINEFLDSNDGFFQVLGLEGTSATKAFPTEAGTTFDKAFQPIQDQLDWIVRGAVDDLGEVTLNADNVIRNVREKLFNGIERDLVVNQGRQQKLAISKRLLGRMVQEGTTEIDLSKFAIDMYDNGTITSRTIERVSAKVESLFNKELSRLGSQKDTTFISGHNLLKTDELLKELDALGVKHPSVRGVVSTKNPKLTEKIGRVQSDISNLKNELSVEAQKFKANAEDYIAQEKITALETRIATATKQEDKFLAQFNSKADNELAKLKSIHLVNKNRYLKDIAKNNRRAENIGVLEQSKGLAKKVVDDFQTEYLLHITGAARGNTVSIFNDIKQNLDMFFDTYGMHTGSLSDFLKTSSNRIDYIGTERLAIAYGDDIADNVKKITEMVSDSRFTSMIDELRLGENPASAQFVFNLFKSFLSGTRRWSISHMLGGGFLPATRFFGMNRITAPHIFFTSVGGALGMRGGQTALKFVGTAFTGDLARLADLVPRALGKGRKMENWFDFNRLLYVDEAETIIDASKTEALRSYSAGELREMIDLYGIEFSRTKIEFYETEITNMLTSQGLTIGGATKSGFGKKWAMFDPSQQNIYGQYAQYQDAELRRLVFVEALKGGARPADAAELARRSMLDYNSLSKFEKENVGKYVYFYSFMRSMGTEMVNAMYRAWKGKLPLSSFVPKLIKAQDNLNRTTAEDYYSMSNQQLARIYNIYHGTVDGKDLYMSGAVNPQMQMFELMSNWSVRALQGGADVKSFAQDPSVEGAMKVPTLAKDAMFNAMYYLLLEGSTSNPIGQYVIKQYDMASNRNFRPPSIQSELVTMAEMEGKLPELIKMYGLVEKPYITDARPLSSEGKQYAFPNGAMYKKFLNHQLIGLATSNVAMHLGFISRHSTGIELVEYRAGQRDRFWADAQKAAQIGQPTGITVPDGQGGTIVIPTAQRYLKSRTRQDEASGDWQEQIMTAYLLGFTTPISSTPDTKKLEYNLRAILADLEKTQKQYTE